MGWLQTRERVSSLKPFDCILDILRLTCRIHRIHLVVTCDNCRKSLDLRIRQPCRRGLSRLVTGGGSWGYLKERRRWDKQLCRRSPHNITGAKKKTQKPSYNTGRTTQNEHSPSLIHILF